MFRKRMSDQSELRQLPTKKDQANLPVSKRCFFCLDTFLHTVVPRQMSLSRL